VQNQQSCAEVCNKAPVRARATPLPEIIRAASGGGGVLEWQMCVRWSRTVRECDVEKENLDQDCKEGLNQERGAEVCAEPVKYPAIER
jgi:hypothetical protein